MTRKRKYKNPGQYSLALQTVVAVDQKRIFKKYKKREALEAACIRVHQRMVELATGLEAPCVPDEGFWQLKIGYAILERETNVDKRNLQRVMKRLTKTHRVEVAKNATFTTVKQYKIYP